MCCIYTIGYEGKSTAEFVDLLNSNKIETVIDVREIPLSRKPGFSKGALTKLLSASGINYVHIKGLGSPKAIRDDLKLSHNYELFFHRYRDYIAQHEGFVREAWELSTNERCCLLCYEKAPAECHRSVIVSYMQEHMPGVDGVINL